MSFGFGFGLPSWQTLSGGFSPASLFSAGENGAWYDPSDLTTLFTDSAGTTPVTGVEQFVGRMNDKSGRGNHATSTGTKRPKLAARYNLLTYSEQFDNALGWIKNQVTVTANATSAPNGTTTADQITTNSGGVTGSAYVIYQGKLTVSGQVLTSSLYVKNGSGIPYIAFTADQSVGTVWFNCSTGAVDRIVGSVTATSTNIGDGWYRFSVTYTVAATDVQDNQFWHLTNRTALTTANPAFSGGEYVYIWGADLRPASQATGLIGPTYQRVVDAATYDAAGFLPYLVADGVDDAMNTGNIVPGTDKAQVFAGLRKLTDAAQGVVAELSATIASNNGTLLLAAPDGATQTYGFDSKGTAQVDAVASSLAAPRTNVVTGLADIAGDSCVIRVNGAVADTDTGDQGTGDYLTYPLYLFGRGGTSVYFNGWMYGLIIRFGPNLSTSQIESTEAYLNQKSGSY